MYVLRYSLTTLFARNFRYSLTIWSGGERGIQSGVENLVELPRLTGLMLVLNPKPQPLNPKPQTGEGRARGLGLEKSRGADLRT